MCHRPEAREILGHTRKLREGQRVTEGTVRGERCGKLAEGGGRGQPDPVAGPSDHMPSSRLCFKCRGKVVSTPFAILAGFFSTCTPVSQHLSKWGICSRYNNSSSDINRTGTEIFFRYSYKSHVIFLPTLLFI